MGDRERWDAKHAASAGGADTPLDPLVVEALDRLGPGSGRGALDLAAGSGRHALELARRGYRVEAWDVSPVALERLAGLAAEEGLEVGTREVDLTGGVGTDATAGSCELVVVVNFLERALLASLWRLLAPGGHALVSTFTVDREGDHPRREWCLERGELAHGLPGFEPVFTAETGGRAFMLARRSGDLPNPSQP